MRSCPNPCLQELLLDKNPGELLSLIFGQDDNLLTDELFMNSIGGRISSKCSCCLIASNSSMSLYIIVRQCPTVQAVLLIILITVHAIFARINEASNCTHISNLSRIRNIPDITQYISKYIKKKTRTLNLVTLSPTSVTFPRSS